MVKLSEFAWPKAVRIIVRTHKHWVIGSQVRWRIRADSSLYTLCAAVNYIM